MQTLTLLLLIPLLGALSIALLPGERHGAIRAVATIASAAALIYAWSLLGAFDRATAELQFFEQLSWNPLLGTTYSLGLDGISFPMVLLTTLLCLIAILASAGIGERVKGYYALLLVLESAILGVFTAQDWALFYIFWELTLIPLFFLIDRWGGRRRQMAALNFVIYTMGGSVFMLLALLVLFDLNPSHSFAMAEMGTAARALPPESQTLIFLGLLVGFGVKMPIFPLHGWLPLAHVEAPSTVSILLSGVLVKMGAYGLIRAVGMLPAAMLALQGMLTGLALFSIIYGGLLAWRQTDLKRMIAYSTVSHMGVVLLGIAALNQAGLTGAVMQMVAHGLVAGATFLLIGLLYERTHTREINDYSSLVRITPRFAFFSVIAFLGAFGMPGTAGFIAELHVLVGGFERWGWWVLILSIGVLISAAYSIRTIGRLFTGPVRPKMRDIEDLRPVELIAATTLTAGIITIGIFPAATLDLIASSVAELSGLYSVR